MRNQTIELTSIELTSPTLGSLFTISESDWTAVSKRVGLTSLTKDIADQIARSLPDFPTLVVACQTWKDTTFPGLITQANNLSAYAAQSITGFTALQTMIAGLDPNQPLPAGAKAEAEKVIGDLARSSEELTGASSLLEEQVASFLSVNRVIDTDIKSYTAKLSPQWASLTAPVDAVDSAIGLIQGAWRAIDNDLQSVVSGTIPITTPFLMGLNIQVAINTWQTLQSESTAFPAMAQGQDVYLTGQWLIGN